MRLATSTSILSSAAWRYVHPRFLIQQRLSFVTNRFVGSGSLAQIRAEGRGTTAIWRADLTMPFRVWQLEAGAKREHQRGSQTLGDFTFQGGTGLRLRGEQVVDDRRVVDAAWMHLSRPTPIGCSGSWPRPATGIC